MGRSGRIRKIGSLLLTISLLLSFLVGATPIDAQAGVIVQKVGFSSPEPFAEGDVIYLGANIVNTGGSTTVFVEFHLDGRLYDSGPISLGAGAATAIWSDIPWRATAGSHTFTFAAGSSSLSRSFAVSGGSVPPPPPPTPPPTPPQPNLADLHPYSIYLSPSDKTGNSVSIVTQAFHYDVGTGIYFSPNIENLGSANATNFKANVYIDGVLLESRLVDPIAPGAGYAWGTNTWRATKGTHVVEVVVDVDNIITESDETNNRASTTIIVEEFSQLPDLYVAHLSFEPSKSQYTVGEEILIQWSVGNSGPVSALNESQLFINGSNAWGFYSQSEIKTWEVVDIPAYAWKPTEKGRYLIEAVADPTNRVRESNETNNNLSFTIIVDDIPQPVNRPPAALIQSISPNPAKQGETVYFSGSGSDPDGNVVGYSWNSNIDGDLSNSASFSISSLSAGTHTIYFWVQDNNGEWSSQATATVTVSETSAKPVGDWTVEFEVSDIRLLTEVDPWLGNGRGQVYMWYGATVGFALGPTIPIAESVQHQTSPLDIEVGVPYVRPTSLDDRLPINVTQGMLVGIRIEAWESDNFSPDDYLGGTPETGMNHHAIWNFQVKYQPVTIGEPVEFVINNQKIEVHVQAKWVRQ